MERDPDGRRYRYMLLATSRTGRMEQELNGVPPEFEVVGMTVFESTFGGDESAVILQAEASALASALTTAPTSPSAGPSDVPAAGEPSIHLVADDGSRQLVAPSTVRRVEEEGGWLFSQPKRFAILAGLNAPTRTSNHIIQQFTDWSARKRAPLESRDGAAVPAVDADSHCCQEDDPVSRNHLSVNERVSSSALATAGTARRPTRKLGILPLGYWASPDRPITRVGGLRPCPRRS